ncbi:hypothetical protein B0H16DRAFT_1775746 [Mycena metata]|uniref:Uncharacterized protein n=1 Tax=Mycena metata TaxID=1033252 RepID=A0AAD7HWK9_9AGAR|nr:hypothetical protein B0H16DRAFT_1775746 [Mycena metata]
MDLTMQVTFNGQQRTLRETVALALSAGWKVVRVTKAPRSLFGHIVAVPVAVPVPPQRRARAGSGSAFRYAVRRWCGREQQHAWRGCEWGCKRGLVLGSGRDGVRDGDGEDACAGAVVGESGQGERECVLDGPHGTSSLLYSLYRETKADVNAADASDLQRPGTHPPRDRRARALRRKVVRVTKAPGSLFGHIVAVPVAVPVPPQ